MITKRIFATNLPFVYNSSNINICNKEFLNLRNQLFAKYSLFECAQKGATSRTTCRCYFSQPRLNLKSNHPFAAFNLNNNQRWCGHKCITHQDCWKCGRSIEPDMEQYFCVCGVVQPPMEHRSFFQIFGISEQFDVDLKYLNEKYKKLQVLLHPDKYSQKSDTEKGFSQKHSTLVNEAYNTLMKPLSRGLYMLHLKGEDLEKEVQIESDFLAEVMELNESVIEAEGINALKAIETTNSDTINKLIAEISKNFKDKETNLAKENLLKLKYLINVAEKLQDLIRANHF